MIYFCADDYGISKKSNCRIESCLENGVLNKISVLPNGDLTDINKLLSDTCKAVALHINLVEGCPISEHKDVSLLTKEDGYFKHSFIGLLFLSLSAKRQKLKKQIYKEIQAQIRLYKTIIGDKTDILLDSHQHTHMIPLVFKTLMRVIKDEGLNVKSLRIPAEPILPYVFTPSLYGAYTLTGIIKQWLLKFFAVVNHNELKKSKIKSPYFMGVMFSGRLDETKIKKLLLHYIKIAEKKGKDIEIGFHPGYLTLGEELIPGARKSFENFYFSPWRKVEYDTIINFKY